MPCERLSTDAFAHGAALCGGRVGGMARHFQLGVLFCPLLSSQLSLSAAWASASAMLRAMQSGGVRASAPSDTAAIGFLPQIAYIASGLR